LKGYTTAFYTHIHVAVQGRWGDSLCRSRAPGAWRLALESASRAGGCRGATSRPAGTGDHLVPVPVFSWLPGYRDEPPIGCRSCASRGVTSRPACRRAPRRPSRRGWPPGYLDEPTGGRRGCAGRGVTSRPAGTGDHLGPGPVGWALPIGIGHWATGMAWPTGRCRNVPV